jgi:RNA polymerase sigma-70 factor, ECF subfamily
MGAARRRAQQGGLGVRERPDQVRFASVFLPYLTDAYRLARWLTGSAADAEDVVQEAALRAFKGILAFSGGNARAWTLTITRNTAYSWLAKNRPATLVLVEDASEAEAQQGGDLAFGASAMTPEAALLLRAEADAVRHAMAALSPPFREVLVLREIHELDYRTIAAVVGIPIGTVMSRLARARRLVIQALGSQR